MTTTTINGVTLVNLTPHAITLVGVDNGNDLVIPASGELARVSSETVTIGDIGGIPLTTTTLGEVKGLPDPKEGTILIVSLAVAKAVPGRMDVVITNESVRDENGRIIGCKSLARV